MSAAPVPANRLEQALAAVAAEQMDDAAFFAVLWESELLLPQPFAQDDGPSRDWQIAVFEGVCPAYTSVEQFVKAIPSGMAYAQVPVPLAVQHWDPERPLALNFAADLAVQIPGPLVKALPNPPAGRLARLDDEATPELVPASGPLPEPFAGQILRFAHEHPEVRALHLASVGDSGRTLVGVLIDDGVPGSTVAASMAAEIQPPPAQDISAYPFSEADPGPLGRSLLAGEPPFWERSLA